jgi:hypothetical protein
VKKQFPLLTILVLAIVFIAACTKIVNTDIGGDLIPPIDGVNTKEMFLDVVTKNVKDTVVKVGIGTPNALGFVTDPLFGKTEAAINVELKPTSFPVYPVAGDDIKVDSVVLVLGYNGVWGDSTQHVGLKVYEVKNTDPAKDVLDQDTTYATDYVVERGDDLTENFAVSDIDITKLNDSIYPFEEAAINQLRVRLDKNYGTELLTGYDTTATGAYHSDSLFERFFKGYQIVPQYGNALLRINLLDTNTKLAIYYNFHVKDSATAKRDTAVRYFRTSAYTYRTGSSNYITRERSGTDIPKFIPDNNTTKNDSLLFVDANPGIFTRITIDSLSTLSNRIIHRAEIIMEQVPGDALKDALFTPPNLFLTPVTADSTPRFALPYDVIISNGTIVNQATFGCVPYKKTDPFTQQTIYYYTFDITRYAQNIISRKDSSYPLVLYAPSNDYVYTTESSIYVAYTGTSAGPLNVPAIGRVRLGGGNHSSHKMRLHIVYSDIK